MSIDAAAHIRGEVTIRPLANVKPNGWNPNRMTPEMRESLKHGFRVDGWLMSQALLVWGTDDTGVRRDLIIDGEHRWEVATELAMVDGPMVFLDGLSETDAKKLTVKMNQKRGEWDTVALGELLRSFGKDVAGIDLGFGDDELTRLTHIDQTESTAFLDRFTNGAGDTDPPPPGDEGTTSTPSDDGYMTFAVKLLPAQDELVQKALRAAKRKFGVRHNVEAFVAMCNAVLKEESNGADQVAQAR